VFHGDTPLTQKLSPENNVSLFVIPAFAGMTVLFAIAKKLPTELSRTLLLAF